MVLRATLTAMQPHVEMHDIVGAGIQSHSQQVVKPLRLVVGVEPDINICLTLQSGDDIGVVARKDGVADQ